MSIASGDARIADLPGANGAHDAVTDLGRRAQAASRVLANASTGAKNAALERCAQLLDARRGSLLAANQADLDAAAADGLAAAPLDRLRLTEARIDAMAAGLRSVAALADPVGEVLDGTRRPNGLLVERVRVPLGVVAIIYENRPNVTSDAFGLCVKSGNAAILRGSGSALRSNVAIGAIARDALTDAGLPADALIVVDDPSHATAVAVMQLDRYVDALIPRGGPALIRSMREHATVPVILDGDGNCHVYVDEHADLEMALAIVVNAKTQRTSVCNAAESLVVHAAVADTFVPLAAHRLVEAGVELVGDTTACRLSAHIAPATDDDFGREFLDLKLSVAVAPSLDAAIEHVNHYGTGHTEAIVTRDVHAARRFTREVDAAAVVVNASTRFTDGEQFGFGAEIGISTQKLHARGPMGLRELTTYKYLVWGEGQVRG
jgi:glutamate-5-semialdehyde dehydrogenase